MKGALALRNPVGSPAVLNTGSTNVTNAAYVELITAANRTKPCDAILIHNPGAEPLKLAQGAAGSEVDLGFVIPIAVSVIVPMNLKAGVRLAVKSLGGTQSSGIVTCTFLA